MMAQPAGEAEFDAPRLDFDGRLKPEVPVRVSPPMQAYWPIANSMTRSA
jgi:hypothetical protein